jgi:hypothetical protein
VLVCSNGAYSNYTKIKEPRADVGRDSTREASAQKIFASVRLLGLIVVTVFTVAYCTTTVIHCVANEASKSSSMIWISTKSSGFGVKGICIVY